MPRYTSNPNTDRKAARYDRATERERRRKRLAARKRYPSQLSAREAVRTAEVTS